MDIFRQGDSRWSSRKIGYSSLTLGQVGCTLSCLAQALVVLGVNKDATPGGVLDYLTSLDYWKHRGKSASIDAGQVARLLGLDADGKLVGTLPQLRAFVSAALSNDGLALLCVDNNGDANGDHYILALGTTENSIVCSDPATGALISLDKTRLECVVYWGVKQKQYSVRSVRSLRAKKAVTP